MWDLLEYKLLKHVPSLHGTEVTNLFVYNISGNASSIQGVSCEDQGGVRLFTINKKAIFGGYSATQEYLFKSKMKGTTQIRQLVPNPLYKNQFCDNS